MEVDLFASTWNHQLPCFVSWFLHTGAWRTYAFSIEWGPIRAYAFPSFNLIPKCFTKIAKDRTTLVLIAPYWPSQPWFPVLLELFCDYPRLFFPHENLLTSPLGACDPLTQSGSIRLIAFRLSGVVSSSKEFRNRLQTCCLWPLEKIHTMHTKQLKTAGMLGVLEGISIPCLLA